MVNIGYRCFRRWFQRMRISDTVIVNMNNNIAHGLTKRKEQATLRNALCCFLSFLSLARALFLNRTLLTAGAPTLLPVVLCCFDSFLSINSHRRDSVIIEARSATNSELLSAKAASFLTAIIFF